MSDMDSERPSAVFYGYVDPFSADFKNQKQLSHQLTMDEIEGCLAKLNAAYELLSNAYSICPNPDDSDSILEATKLVVEVKVGLDLDLARLKYQLRKMEDTKSDA